MKKIILILTLFGACFCWSGHSQKIGTACSETNDLESIKIGAKPENFTFRPNPLRDLLSLQATSDIQEISIYDRLGRETMKKNPGSAMANLNISSLNDGVYLMNVTIDDMVQSYKLVKN